MEDRWLTWAKRLQAIASTGRHFSREKFDRERYDDIAAIANDMLAALAQVPVARIESLVSDFATGYATPKVDVRGALFAGGKILLVKEAGDGLWSLPGGFADVGRSPSENIEKELWEEAGEPASQGHGSLRRSPQGAARLPAGRARFLQAVFHLRADRRRDARPRRRNVGRRLFCPRRSATPVTRAHDRIRHRSGVRLPAAHAGLVRLNYSTGDGG